MRHRCGTRTIAMAGLAMGGLAAVALAGAGTAAAAPAYRQVGAVALGAPDRWDYVVADAASRVYVAHGDRVAVVDATTATLIGTVEGIAGGTHGAAVSAAAGLGFTDDGRNGQVVIFDLKSLKVVKTLAAAADADAIVAEPSTGHIFVVDGDPRTITVVDPATQAVVATIAAGEKLEYAAAGEPGIVYVAGEEKSDLLKVDARSNAVVARWATPDCTSPHGLAYDAAARRLFMGCVNSKLMVVDANTGRVVTELAIGRGSDAVAWDAGRRRVFSSNGADGTITVFQQRSPDDYVALEPVVTAVSGRTMAVDPASGRLLVAAADTVPNPAGGRPKVVPGTLKLLIFAPAGAAP